MQASRPSEELILDAGANVGRYVLVGALARERADEVAWLARDRELDREVVLRLRPWTLGPDGDDRDGLREAAQALGGVSHPSVARVFELGVVADLAYCAMERVDGIALRAWLAARRGWRDVLARVIEIGRGLEAVHAAGFTHGDLTADRVMVARDGHAIIVDPGLGGARTAGDPSADQRALAALAFEALFGRRPDTDDGARLRAALERGEPRSADLGGVPLGVARAIVRGLADEPTRRWPSVTGLLAGLEPTLRRRRRRAAWSAAALVFGGLAAIALTSRSDHDPEREVRNAGEARMASAWNPEQRASLQLAFARLGQPTGAEIEALALGALDRYREAWLDARVAAWRRALDGGHDGRRKLELQLDCLERLAEEVEAYVRLIPQREDADELRRAGRAAQLLTPVSSCADPEPLDPAGEPGTAEAAATLRREQARLRAVLRASGAAEVHARARKLVDEAEPLGEPRLLAEFLLLQAIAENNAGEFAAAEATLRRAIDVASKAGAHRTVASAWIHLLEILGVRMGRIADANALIPAAEAAVLLAGDDDFQRGDLAAALTSIAAASVDYPTALRRAEECERYLLAARGPGFGPAIDCLRIRGMVLLHDPTSARMLEGRRLLERAHQEATTYLGPHDPVTGSTLSALAQVADQLDDRPAAIDYARRSLEVQSAVFGPSSTAAATVRGDLGNYLARAGQRAAAIAELGRAADDLRAAYGFDHDDVLLTRLDLGYALGRGGEPREGERVLGDALRALVAAHPDATDDLLLHRLRLAAIVATTRPAAALPMFEAAFGRLLELGIEDTDESEFLAAAGEAAIRVGRPAWAQRWLARMPDDAARLEDLPARLADASGKR